MDKTPPSGLTSIEAAERLLRHGPNALRPRGQVTWWRLAIRQFTSPLVLLLFGACAVAGFMGDWVDAAAIATIVLLNALIGFTQEFNAHRELAALGELTAPRARVLRDGTQVQVPAADVVPGDVLLLEAGEVVAADALLVAAEGLATDEGTLTGESLPAEKDTVQTVEGTALAERTDWVFMGTSVATGRGRGTVVATGMQTEMGRIASMLADASDVETPLQRRLARLGQTLLVVCLALVGLVILLGVARGLPLSEILFVAIALAVAAVPEGLPAVVTVALAIGVRRMAAREALVRHLPAVETLGSATVICTDKTGTLTTGEMAVREVVGSGVVEAAAACLDSQTDPTEIAIRVAAQELGIDLDALEVERPRVRTVPFSAATRRMEVHRSDGLVYVKGAPEVIYDVVPPAALEMAGRGLRVLAVAMGPPTAVQPVGLLGLADPPRPEVRAALQRARDAGIRPIVMTGDNLQTATAIAKEVGLLPGEVHARMTPADKLEMVRALVAAGEVVAMTGDGVNDAPAVREAHIGIAMGRRGTEVTRSAADMVLVNDDYGSIVAAVEEGRAIYANIRKAVVYLLAGNLGEIIVVVGALIVGLPLPLQPVHLLWINLVTDGVPALALVTDPKMPDQMRQPPRPRLEPILPLGQWARVIATGGLDAAVVLSVFVWAIPELGEGAARTLCFTTLAACQLFRALTARSDDQPFWRLPSNPGLLAVVGVTLLFQVLILALPGTREMLQLTWVAPSLVAGALAVGMIPAVVLTLVTLVQSHLKPVVPKRSS